MRNMASLGQEEHLCIAEMPCHPMSCARIHQRIQPPIDNQSRAGNPLCKTPRTVRASIDKGKEQPAKGAKKGIHGIRKVVAAPRLVDRFNHPLSRHP